MGLVEDAGRLLFELLPGDILADPNYTRLATGIPELDRKSVV